MGRRRRISATVDGRLWLALRITPTAREPPPPSLNLVYNSRVASAKKSEYSELPKEKDISRTSTTAAAMEFIVDVQGFQSLTNDFIVKEMAVVEVSEGAEVSTFVFGPPHCCHGHMAAEYRPQNIWLQNYFHGIPWLDGSTPYSTFDDVLNDTIHGSCKIYVKGADKKQWLTKYIVQTIVNLQDYGCPSLEELCDEIEPDCFNHPLTDRPVCAKQNVQVLREWFSNYWM